MSLQSQSAVDKTRLGVVGHDYGGMYAMLMAGADPRAKTYLRPRHVAGQGARIGEAVNAGHAAPPGGVRARP